MRLVLFVCREQSHTCRRPGRLGWEMRHSRHFARARSRCTRRSGRRWAGLGHGRQLLQPTVAGARSQATRLPAIAIVMASPNCWLVSSRPMSPTRITTPPCSRAAFAHSAGTLKACPAVSVFHHQSPSGGQVIPYRVLPAMRTDQPSGSRSGMVPGTAMVKPRDSQMPRARLTAPSAVKQHRDGGLVCDQSRIRAVPTEDHVARGGRRLGGCRRPRGRR